MEAEEEFDGSVDLPSSSKLLSRSMPAFERHPRDEKSFRFQLNLFMTTKNVTMS
jgi:hypothetical protein